MVVVHRVFRREFRLLPALIREVPDGDLTRAETLGKHCEELTTALHHHHTGEDELLWPRLRARTEVDRELIALMEKQHHRVAELLAQVEQTLPQWRQTADARHREKLVATLDEVSVALEEHLAQEEREILPLAERYLTVEEWEELGTRAMASIPKERLLVVLGHILEDTTPDERQHMLGNVPLPGRVLYRVVGQRKWRREVEQIRGGVTVPSQRTPE
jgi:iron-sulfur cluster repair protein YtfE (RIC family)